MKYLRSTALALAAASSVFFACSSPDASSAKPTTVADDAQDLTAKDFRVVGNLQFGETSAATRYAEGPRYRAFTFDATATDEVDVWVRSINGDPMLWALDSEFHVAAYNDDAARGSRDAHVRFAAKATGVHYLLVRDYELDPMTFTVSLSGTASWAGSCTVDADCAKIDRGCCPSGDYLGVRSAAADAYRETLACSTPERCPRIALAPDARVAQCNGSSHRCELVAPAAIRCGGFSPNPHACPGGYACKVSPEIVDAPGTCELLGTDDGTSNGTDVDSDCRDTGCDGGHYCSLCWGSWACVPHGAKC